MTARICRMCGLPVGTDRVGTAAHICAACADDAFQEVLANRGPLRGASERSRQNVSTPEATAHVRPVAGQEPGTPLVPPCEICGKPVPDYKPLRCCSGADCACRGLPINPCVCSHACYYALIKGIGKPMEERARDAGITLPNPPLTGEVCSYCGAQLTIVDRASSAPGSCAKCRREQDAVWMADARAEIGAIGGGI